MRLHRTLPIATLTTFALVVALSIAPVPPASAAHATRVDPPVTTAADPAPEPTPTVPPAVAFTHPLAKKTYTLSSYFGARCLPLAGASTFHQGIDLAAKGGQPILAIAAGVVTATSDGTSGRVGYVTIRHLVDGAEHLSRYLHVWKSTTHVKVGDIVTAGQRISSVGSSGGSTGNHLHLEVLTRSGSGWTAIDPAPFLKDLGVDLAAGATAVSAKKTPATCRYYATTALYLRAGPATSKTAVRLLARGTAMTHVPGLMTSGFIPVMVGATSGWVSSSYVTPVKPAVAATYKTTSNLSLRKSASTSAKRILVIPKGKSVGTIKATSGAWRKVTYAGKTGWVHSSYLKKR